MIFSPNLGCLLMLLLLALAGGTPLLVGLARVAVFFTLFLVAAGTLGTWWLRRRALGMYARQAPGQRLFVETLVELLVKLAEVDGPLDRREVTAIRHFFQNDLGYRAERLLWVRDLLKEARRSTLGVPELCERLLSNYDLQARMIVLDVLTRVAIADGKMGPAEGRFLDEVANRLGLGPFVASFGWARAGAEQQQQQQNRGPRPQGSVSINQALATLGLDRGASAEDIKQAWRRLSKENHPDRVTHLGEEFRRVAETRMRAINAAYDALKNAGLVS